MADSSSVGPADSLVALGHGRQLTGTCSCQLKYPGTTFYITHTCLFNCSHLLCKLIFMTQNHCLILACNWCKKPLDHSLYCSAATVQKSCRPKQKARHGSHSDPGRAGHGPHSTTHAQQHTVVTCITGWQNPNINIYIQKFPDAWHWIKNYPEWRVELVIQFCEQYSQKSQEKKCTTTWCNTAEFNQPRPNKAAPMHQHTACEKVVNTGVLSPWYSGYTSTSFIIPSSNAVCFPTGICPEWCSLNHTLHIAAWD